MARLLRFLASPKMLTLDIVQTSLASALAQSHFSLFTLHFSLQQLTWYRLNYLTTDYLTTSESRVNYLIPSPHKKKGRPASLPVSPRNSQLSIINYQLSISNYPSSPSSPVPGSLGVTLPLPPPLWFSLSLTLSLPLAVFPPEGTTGTTPPPTRPTPLLGFRYTA